MTNFPRRTALVTLAASAALIGLVGCAGTNDNAPQASEAATAPSTTQTTAEQSPAPALTASPSESDDTSAGGVDATEYAAAITAAQELIGDGAFAYDLDREDDDADDDEVFNIDVVAGTTVHEVDILADGTARLDETETNELDSEDQAEIDAARLTMIEAIQAALRHASGTIESVELETEDGTVVWKIEFEDDTSDDLLIDAVSGAVTPER